MRSLLAASVLVASCALTGCSSAGASQDDVIGRPVTLVPGQTVPLPAGAGLSFKAVESDSRCPPGVQCIQAGEATVLFELRPAGGEAQPLRLTTTPPADRGAAGGWRIKLLELDHGAPPRATVQIVPPN